MTRRFTGFHMLVVMIGFFGTVIAVNLVMATMATRTFGGTVVDNSYVASQKFNGWLQEARAQKALGWSLGMTLDARRHPVAVIAAGEIPLTGAVVSAMARHPLGRAPDIALSFAEVSPGRFRAMQALPAGRWLLHVETARDGAVMRSVNDIQ